MADVLFGDVSPGGRLPVTFYRSVDQIPAFDDYAMEGRTYRYFRGEPLYPFGHGLSYSRFAYSGLKVSRRPGGHGTIEASLDVKNAGPRDGDEVVQLYVRDVAAKPPAANRELRGFERVHLEAGETPEGDVPGRPRARPPALRRGEEGDGGRAAAVRGRDRGLERGHPPARPRAGREMTQCRRRAGVYLRLV